MIDTSIHFQFDSADQSPGFLLWQVSMLWHREISRVLVDYSLTHTQFVLLATIAWIEQSQRRLSKNELGNQKISQTEIANTARIDTMTTSNVLRSLEQKGFLERVNDTVDSRVKLISLTSTGKIILQPALEAVESFDKHFFGTVVQTSENFIKQCHILLNYDNRNQ